MTSKPKPQVKKVVLAYSGGLDTSVIVPWLKEHYDCDVVCFCADVGQGDDAARAHITAKREKAHPASGEQTAPEAVVEGWLNIKAYADSFNVDRQKAFDQLLLTLHGLESDSNDFEQWARRKVGARLPTEVSQEDWYRKLAEIVGDMQVERIGFAIPAWECQKNTALVRAFLSGIRSQNGEPRFVYKIGTADLNIVAPIWKCPAVVYGPGVSALDHTGKEHIHLEDYRRAVAILSMVLSRLSSLIVEFTVKLAGSHNKTKFTI